MSQPQSLRTRWKKVALPNKMTVGCTVVIAAATVWYAITSRHQLAAMQDQLKLTNQALTDAQRASASATDQTWKAIGNLNWLANSMDASVKSAKDAFVRDQRPYIWLTNTGLGGPEFTATGQITWNYHYTNYGRAPAYNLTTHSFMKIGVDKKFLPSYSDKPVHYIGVPMPPNNEQFGTAISNPGITRSEYDRLLGIENGIAVRLIAEYSDAYGGKYETSICAKRLINGMIAFCDNTYIK